MPKCALCRTEAKLLCSHIIPAFVFRWLRRTSATGFIRSTDSPNQRIQDGLKTPLLCQQCEQRFSRWERTFANRIFNPVLKDSTITVDYGDWFLKFCVSISWRALTYTRSETLLEHFPEKLKREAERALTRWAGFLLDELPHPDRFEQHVVVFDSIEGGDVRTLPPNMNRYLLRGIDVDLAHSDTSAFVFSKIGPFALFGMIEKPSGPWRGTKVARNEGTVGPRRYELSQNILDYWKDRAIHHSELYRRISDAQQAKIEGDVLRDPARFIASDTFKALEHDVRLFGERAFHSKNANQETQS